MERELFLGLDLSTQSLTALVVSVESGIVHQEALDFDQTYPRYGTRGGVLPSADPLRAHVDPMMWLEALEDTLSRLKQLGLTPRIAAMAISAQQHGTVYLRRQAASGLSSLDPSIAMAHGLAGIFSRRTCPIWMDSSTRCECREVTHTLGGDAAVAGLTGSVATERFAGPQIRKFFKEDPEAYARTAHIALISSFVTSVLTGSLAPVDAGVVEAQAMALYLHAGWVGNRPMRLIATAGGSQNEGLLKVIAEVFGAEVQTLEVKESAALGAAMRAAHAWLAEQGAGAGWGEIFQAVVKPGTGRTIRPTPGASLPYQAPGGLLSLYAACERHAAWAGPSPDEAMRAFRVQFSKD